MTPFKVKLNPKFPIFDQVVAAAQKAIVSGSLKLGEPFPSVRSLAADLKIHPNTAHKVVQHLIQEQWLISSPGKGTTVAKPPTSRAQSRKQLLDQEINQLVNEALRLGVSLEEVKKSLDAHWKSVARLKVIANDH